MNIKSIEIELTKEEFEKILEKKNLTLSDIKVKLGVILTDGYGFKNIESIIPFTNYSGFALPERFQIILKEPVSIENKISSIITKGEIETIILNHLIEVKK